MAKKTKPNFTPFGNKKSGRQKTIFDDIFKPGPTRSKTQDSRKVHDTKGKNKHARNNW